MGGPNNVQTTGRSSKRRKSIGVALSGTDSAARALFHCNYCNKDISNTIRVKCAVCPDFDLCLECFSVGVEIHPHKRSHAYRVVDNLSFPLFTPDWGADEELLLLEGVDMAGLGNWAAVAEHVGTKGQDACRQHYYDIYINCQSFPEPMPAPSMASIDKLQAGKDRLKAKIGDAQLAANAPPGAAGEAAPAASAAVGSALESGMASGVAAAPDAEHVDDAGTPHRTFKTEEEGALGPERGRAEEEHHSQASAEKTRPGKTMSGRTAIKKEPTGDSNGDAPGADSMADVHPEDGDGSDNEALAAPGKKRRGSEQQQATERKDPPQKGQKRLPEEQVGQRGMPGNATLLQAAAALATPKPSAQKGPSQRNKQGGGGQHAELSGYHAKRHEFEPEYDQDAELMVAELEFRDADTQEEREEKLRMVQLYNERLTERERRRDFLRARDLLNMRRMQGIERRRTPRDREFHAKLRPLAKYQPQPQHEVMAEGLLLEARLRARLLELKEMRRAGVRTFAEAENYEADRKRRALEEGGARGDRAHARHRGRADEDDPAILAQASERLTGGGQGQRYASGSVGVTVASELAGWRSRRGVGLDITALPDMSVLSAKERELCASARMLPSQYLAIKAAMLREAAQRGILPRSEARTVCRLDASRALKVYDLLVACGWMIGSHTSASSAAVHRVGGQPGPSGAGVVKCDPLEGQINQTGFSNSLQGFPGFHIGSYQL